MNGADQDDYRPLSFPSFSYIMRILQPNLSYDYVLETPPYSTLPEEPPPFVGDGSFLLDGSLDATLFDAMYSSLCLPSVPAVSHDSQPMPHPLRVDTLFPYNLECALVPVLPSPSSPGFDDAGWPVTHAGDGIAYGAVQPEYAFLPSFEPEYFSSGLDYAAAQPSPTDLPSVVHPALPQPDMCTPAQFEEWCQIILADFMPAPDGAIDAVQPEQDVVGAQSTPDRGEGSSADIPAPVEDKDKAAWVLSGDDNDDDDEYKPAKPAGRRPAARKGTSTSRAARGSGTGRATRRAAAAPYAAQDCAECGMRFKRDAQRLRHQRLHLIDVKCGVCGGTMSGGRADSLRRNQRQESRTDAELEALGCVSRSDHSLARPRRKAA